MSVSVSNSFMKVWKTNDVNKWPANYMMNDKKLSQYRLQVSVDLNIQTTFDSWCVCCTGVSQSGCISPSRIESRQSRHQRDFPLRNQCSNPQSQSRSPLSPLCGHLGNFQHSNMDLFGEKKCKQKIETVLLVWSVCKSRKLCDWFEVLGAETSL